MKKLKPIIFGCLFNLLAIIVLVIYLKNNKFDADVFLTLVISILALGYFDFIIIEKLLNDQIRKSFKYIIHVNGIRGKSTTTRLIDAGLRNCGYKVFSKTTGTVPTIINTNNEQVKIKRLGNANIREQLKMLRLAKKENAEVLVLECMAVNPELQYICEKHILNANITVITNVRPDHIQDMGETLDDIAYAFTNTIPTNGSLIIRNSNFDNIFLNASKQKNTKVYFAQEYLEEDLMDTFKENIEIALEVANVLNLDKNLFIEGMKKYHHDIGAFEIIKYDDVKFMNGFSINDPVSIKLVYDQIIKSFDSNELTILLNNRSDRPTRILQHIEMLKDLPCKKLLIFGSNLKYVKSKLNKLYPTLTVEILSDIESLKKEKYIFAIGNIGGKGMEIVNYFRNRGERV